MAVGNGVRWFDTLSISDVPFVGGKNASLGEITQALAEEGIPVPPGFAITAQVYRDFIAYNGLHDDIAQHLAQLEAGNQSLRQAGSAIRALISGGGFSSDHAAEIKEAYRSLCDKLNVQECDVAVRSSATAEDLPESSFAGQHESYLNIRGESALLEACKHCLASLYTDRAIAYREERNFPHEQVELSIGVQQMVRSDLACAGVVFTLDTETGFPDVVLVNGAWGLGESVVRGSVNPDRFLVYKPLLKQGSCRPIIERTRGSKLEKLVYTEANAPLNANDVTQVVETTDEEQHALVLDDDELLALSKWGVTIEKHYQRPMDIEWAKDGVTGKMYIVQARPETIESQRDRSAFFSYKLKEKSKVLIQGSSIGRAICSGPVCQLATPAEGDKFPDKAILVTDRTDPDWLPVMRRASAIITNCGGTTSHAAIVSRELKVPAVVGTGHGTEVLRDGMDVTVDCAQGSTASVYEGLLDYEATEISIDALKPAKTSLMINVAMPEGAVQWWQLPVSGVGLARIEFIISSHIGVHPMALLHPEKMTDPAVANKVKALTRNYDNDAEYFVDKLAVGIAKIAASCYPHSAIVRLSDFKSNEYRGLLGGEFYEIDEENPMLGLRGASRYYHPSYREAFELECEALKRAREVIGFDNIIAMIPFCRTPKEADEVLATMANAGLKRGENDLQVYVMCEIPSNVVLAEQFADRFDGFSIGSNDLTQLVLGIDRDSAELRYMFDARDEAVKRMVAQVIKVAHEKGRKVGICGQAPSDYPDFAAFLVECGIDSISMNPDSVIQGSEHVAAAEKALLR
jgi:pyruvate,water dikinase